MSQGCKHVNDPHMCELVEGHSGPHRVRYDGREDKTWSDDETDYLEASRGGPLGYRHRLT